MIYVKGWDLVVIGLEKLRLTLLELVSKTRGHLWGQNLVIATATSSSFYNTENDALRGNKPSSLYV